MTHSINELRPWEMRQAYYYHDDGLLDIVLGLTALLLATLVVFDLVPLIGLVLVLLYGLFRWLKSAYSVPRGRYLAVDPVREDHFQWTAFLVAGLIGLAMAGSFLLHMLDVSGRTTILLVSWIGQESGVLFGLCGTLVLSIVAFMNDLGRFHWYAALSLVLTIMHGLMTLPFFGLSAVLGSIVMLCGVWLLVHFWEKYPLEHENS